MKLDIIQNQINTFVVRHANCNGLMRTWKTATDTVKNRFGGESCTLPAFAIAVYDVIIGSEMLGDYKTVRQGLDWFSRHFTKEYYVLLD
jgi:hypothetical protein